MSRRIECPKCGTMNKAGTVCECYSGSDQRLVRLCVSLTPAEADVFFRMLAMSTGEQTDEDFEELMSIEQKFNAARKPNSVLNKNPSV